MKTSLSDRLRRWPMWCGVAALATANILTGWPAHFSGAFHRWEVLGMPWLTTFSLAFLTPIPWKYNGRRQGPPGFIKGLLQATLSLEALVLALAVIDCLCLEKAGIPFSWKTSLTTNAFYFGPAYIIVGNLIATREHFEEERAQAMIDARIAQTRLLQSQLHPHVLFNAINGITELSRVDPEATERCLVALSDLLRKLLKASGCDLLPFAEERQMAEDYLVLEGLRLGKRLKVSWELDPQLDHQRLPPLLLQPLVENAIKHGISPALQGGEILIEATLEGPEICLTVRNTGLWDPEHRVDGIGIWNLRSRLELASGHRASFRLERQGEWTIAEIRYPASTASTLKQA